MSVLSVIMSIFSFKCPFCPIRFHVYSNILSVMSCPFVFPLCPLYVSNEQDCGEFLLSVSSHFCPF